MHSLSTTKPRYVALVSEATNGFVTIGMPPDKFELLAHATSAALTAAAAFAILPGGELMALGPVALLSVCEPYNAKALLCAGHKGKRDSNRKFLRDVKKLPLPTSATQFTIEKIWW